MEMTTPQLIKLNHRVVGMLATMRTSTSILSGQHLTHITNLIRAVECLLFLAMASRLPLTLALLRDFLSDLAITIVSPRFGFFLGNVMVLTLFLKTSSFSDHKHRRSRNINPAAVHKRNPQPNLAAAAGSNPSSLWQRPVQARVPTSTRSPKPSAASRIATASVPASPEMVRMRCCRRINSENVLVKRESSFLAEEERKGEKLVLRRTKTETRLAGRDDQIHAMRRGEAKTEKKQIISGDLCCMKVEKQQHHLEDHMSRDEFRRTIDDFIAWKQKYLKEEDDEVEEI